MRLSQTSKKYQLHHVGGGGLLLEGFAQLLRTRGRPTDNLEHACTSSNSRTFSIAITAWSAKVSTNSISFFVKGRTRLRHRMITPMGMPSRISGTPSPDRKPAIFWASLNVYSRSARTSGI